MAFSIAICNYLYIGVKKIQNIVKDTIKLCNFIDIIYFNSILDLLVGYVLGFSSRFGIGLLIAIYKLIELKNHLEKQDQYACAIVSVNLIRYYTNGLVSLKKNSNIKKNVDEIIFDLLFIWTRIQEKWNNSKKLKFANKKKILSFDIKIDTKGLIFI